MRDRNPRRSRLLAGAFGLCALAGCALGFDFSDYDTSRPTAEPPRDDSGALAPAVDAAAPDQATLAPLSPLAMRPGTSATLTVTLERSGVAGAIDLTVTGLPAAVVASPVTIAPDATAATITLTAGPSAAVGTSTATVHAALGGVAEGDAALALTITQTRLDPTFGGRGIFVGAPHEQFQDFQLDGAGNAYIGVVATPSDGVEGGNFIIYRFDETGVSTTVLDLSDAADDYQFVLTPAGDFVVVDADQPPNVRSYAADGTFRWEARLAPLSDIGPVGARVTNDGKVLVFGNASFYGSDKNDGVFLASYAVDSGLADPSFDDGGVITIAADDQPTFVMDAALTDAGIVAFMQQVDVTRSTSLCVLTRINFDGQIDPTFADSGAVITTGDDYLDCNCSAIAGHSIVAAATSYTSDGVPTVGLARVNADDGTFDPSFGGGALVPNDWFVGEVVGSVAIAPSGDVFMAAVSPSPDPSGTATVLGDLADGGPNLLFGVGDGGTFPVAVGALSGGGVVRVLKDGRVFRAGTAIIEGTPTWFVARLLP